MTLLLVAFSFILDVAVFFCVYAMITVALNFEQGFTGMFNLGLFLPIIVGAVVAAYLPGRLAMIIYRTDPRLDFVANNAQVLDLLKSKMATDPLTSILLLLVTLAVAAGISFCIGYLSAFPAMKLPAVYLALFMLSLAETIRLVGMQTDWMAGGVMGIATVDLFWWLGSYAYYGSSFFAIGCTVLIVLFYRNICNSPLGRLLKSVRENELTAECVGKDVSKIKRKVMAFSFATLGLAGVVQAFTTGAVVVAGYNRLDYSFWPWLMMIIGGTGNNLGVLLATFLLVMIRRLIMVLKYYFVFLPFDIIWLEPMLLGIMLMIVLVVKPAGLVPEKALKIRRYAQKTLHMKLQSKE